MLNPNELVECTNARLTASHGAITKRLGTQKMHTDAIGGGAAVRGLYQWDAPGGKEIVAVSNGKFYHTLDISSEFTEKSPSPTLSTTGPTFFTTFRGDGVSAALKLYMASANGRVMEWDGTTLSQLDGTDDVPTAVVLAAYHTRMFYQNSTKVKHLTWSLVGDATDCGLGGVTDGGVAMMDLLTGEEIKQLTPLGSSLVVSTEDSLMRFTGYSNEDIQIKQDTEGISGSLGPVGPQAIAPAEQFIAMLTDRGPYLVSESGVQPIGVSIESELDSLNRANINDSVVAYHRGRKEVWFVVDSTTVYVYNVRLQSWSKFTYGVSIPTLTRYEDANGDEWLISGGSDGFVRHMDVGTQDNVLADDSGGSTVTMTVELAPIFFEPGPGVRKQLWRMMLQADLIVDLTFGVKHAFDIDALTTAAVLPTGGTRVETYRIDAAGQGSRLRIQFTDANATGTPVVNGLQIFAYNMLRVDA